MVTEAYARKLEIIKEDAGLSRTEVAQILRTSPRTVVRWASRQAAPRGETRERLLELAVVSQRAAKVMKPEAVSIWLFEPNVFLDFERPVDLVASGQYRDVIGAIDAIGEGVFV